MNSAENSLSQVEIVHKYFSHHIRTNTAVIVAMLEAINEGLSDESMTQMIMESGYLLDIFDRGMSVCFNHILGKKEQSTPDEINLKLLCGLFVTNAVPKDGSCSANIDIPETLSIKCEPYSFKNILQILMHEAALAAQGSFTMSIKDTELTIKPEGGFYENPKIFKLFEEIFDKENIKMNYDNSSIRLRFTDENINS